MSLHVIGNVAVWSGNLTVAKSKYLENIKKKTFRKKTVVHSENLFLEQTAEI